MNQDLELLPPRPNPASVLGPIRRRLWENFLGGGSYICGSADVGAILLLRTSGLKELSVKSKIHPRYQTCNVHCACGNTFVTRSTMPRISVDICSACHPFFTGKQKFVDTAGRVERFSKKFGGTYSFQKNAPPAAAAAKK